MENKVLLNWRNVFLLHHDMEPHFVVYVGTNIGMADLLHNLRTNETEIFLSTKSKQLYVVITAKYATGSESIYRDYVNVNI